MAGATAPAGGLRQSLAEAARRLTSPVVYLLVLGGLQVTLLWELRSIYSTALVLVLAAVLVALIAGLLRIDGRWPLKLAAGTLIALLSSAGPTIIGMVRRASVGITFEHDGLLQVESAIDRLLHGLPIYGVDWSSTPMGSLRWDLPGGNPALHHLAYFPLTVLVGVPFRLMADLLHVPFDYRMVLLAFSGLGMIAILALPIGAASRLMLLAAVFVNPLITLYLWTGRNDVEFLAVLLLAIALMARGRITLAALTLGVAVALKPFAWPAVPFFLLVVALRWRRHRSLGEPVTALGALLIVPLVSVLPFLLANVGAFWTDTVLYTSGGVHDAYPIGGYGFGALLLQLGVIARSTDAFPFGALQAIAMAPVFYVMARAFQQRLTLARWMAGYTLLLFAFTYFARFFNDNYVGVVIALMLSIRPLGGHRLVAAAQAEPGILAA